MKILRVKKTALFDVFTGNGWYNHTRVLVRDGRSRIQLGNPLTKIQLIEVTKTAEELCK